MKTVTIGIPAHNEANGIEKMLRSVLAQRGSSYQVERIIVACDGCTDNTGDIVRHLMGEFPLLELIDDGERLGQIGRLNQFYKLSESDIFVTFDADVTLEGTDVLEQMVAAFSSDEVGLVGGEGAPRTPHLFWEKVFVTWIEIWAAIRQELHGGDNVHNHQGCISALARPLYKQLVIPKEAISNDEYLYFKAKELGFRFVYAREAVVRYACPTTLRDNLKQSSRFILTKYGLQSFFSFDILPAYGVPHQVKFAGIAKVFFQKPLWTILAISTQLCLRLSGGLFAEKFHNGLWTQIQTSK